MPWPFCTQCGTILDPPVGDFVTCDSCGFRCAFEQMNIGEVVTHSALRTKPAWIGEEDEEEDDDEEEERGGGGHIPTTTIATNASSSSSATTSASTPKKVKGNKSKTSSKHVKIEEPCPKCGHPEMYFYTMQLRSVDEGSTVFYECPKCTHKYSQNN